MVIMRNRRRARAYAIGFGAVLLVAASIVGCDSVLFGTGAGPAAVNLRTAGDYVILAKSGISSVPASVITGDIGVSPAQASYLTGFSLTLDGSTQYSTSSQIAGKAYAANYGEPTPTNMTTAIANMETAYNNAAGRTNPTKTELGAGEIGGLTIEPGLYSWGTGVSISSDVTLSGGPNDVWIFQIGESLTLAAGKKVVLSGGALPKNVFWQCAGGCVVNSTASIQGIVLSKTEIALKTGATANGRLLAQTDVSLDHSTVAQP